MRIKEKIKAVSAGFSHSAAMTNSGNVYIWGKGMSADPRPDGSSPLIRIHKDQLLPRKIEIPGSRKAVEICSR